MRTTKKNTAISLEPHVLQFLDKDGRTGVFRKLSRSQFINHIVEEFAEQHGKPIVPEFGEQSQPNAETENG